MPFLTRSRSKSPDSASITRHNLNRRTNVYKATDGAQLAKEKAQARRAQVRKAQIEHRQRKANYVKQLELDISQLREMVTQIQRDSSALKSENDLIRNALIANGTSPPGLSAGSTTQPTASTIATPSATADAQDYPPTFEPYALDSLSSDTDMTVTLSMSKTMGTPCFSVAPFSPSAASSNNDGGWICGSIRLTPAQELQAINFILAYVCLLAISCVVLIVNQS